MPLQRSDYVSDVWKPNQFAGRVVFCTGGAGDICSAQVRALVDLGANACIVGRSQGKTEDVAKDIATARSGAKVIGIGGIDVRSKESLKTAVDRCVAELGGLDILICGAAGNFLAPMTQLSENAFKSVIEIDLIGSYNTVKAALPHLITAGKKAKENNTTAPRILFVSATLHYTGTQLQTHVVAAKAGVDALSSQCALELGPRNITSNVIAPGPIAETEGMKRLARKTDAASGIARSIPTGRMGHVRDIADATVWLCSEAASYVNGTTVIADGGAWRAKQGQPGGAFPYPGFLLSDQPVTGVKTGRKEGAKL